MTTGRGDRTAKIGRATKKHENTARGLARAAVTRIARNEHVRDESVSTGARVSSQDG
jgi:hypothetical protein